MLALEEAKRRFRTTHTKVEVLFHKIHRMQGLLVELDLVLLDPSRKIFVKKTNIIDSQLNVSEKKIDEAMESLAVLLQGMKEY